MFDDSTPRWLIVLAGIVSVASTVAVTVVVTWQWTERMDRVVPSTSGARQPASIDELPDDRGRLRIASEEVEQPLDLPSLQNDYDVDVQGDMAAVTVTQAFENPTDRELEAVYECPLHPDGAVYAMTMQVGERTIRGELKRDQQARETYERARRRGNRAALLSQDRPNLLTQRIASIAPG